MTEPGVMAAAPAATEGEARPSCVIVFGPLRGGTTLFRLMLDGHPMLSCIGETDYLVDHLRRVGAGWRYDREALAEDRVFQAGGLRMPDDRDGAVALRDMVAQIGRDGRIPVLMLHRRMDVAGTLMPDAAVIRFTRDPRDSARSAIGMGWAGSVYFGVEPWMRTERAWQDYAAGRPSAPILPLSYEALVAEPEARLRDVCRFFGISYHGGMLAYPETTTYDLPDAGLAEQWRRKLTHREVALVEGRVGPLLGLAGYEPSGVLPATPGRVERARLALHDRWHVWATLLRKFGPVDPVLRGVGRRFGIRPLDRYASRRIATATRRYLK